MTLFRARHAAALAFSAAIVLAGCGEGAGTAKPKSNSQAEHFEGDGHDHSGHDHAHHPGDGHDHGSTFAFVPREPADGVVDVFPSNYPLAYIAQRIGGDSVKVNFIVPADIDPAFWEPTADDARKIQDADIVLFNGATYEKWASTVTLVESRIVDTSAAFSDKFVTIEGVATHSHGPGGEHSHAGTSFTTWLDPMQAVEQARAVADAFAAQQPAKAADYAARFEELKKELEALDKRLAEATAKVRGQHLVASHPIYHYFARRYGLDVTPMTWEPGVHPDAEEWVKFAAVLAEHPATLMLWEGEPAKETQERLEEEGVKWVVVEPVMNRPEKGDLLSHLNANAESLESALK